MCFKNELDKLMAPTKTNFLAEGAKIPTNKDIYYRAKQEEIIEQYLAARLFICETETDEWDYWIKSAGDEKSLSISKLKLTASFYEAALFFYNIIVDLSWAVCYICAEYAYETRGERIPLDGMMSIEQAYVLLRKVEEDAASPTSEGNPFNYLKKMTPEFTKAIDCIFDFWRDFHHSEIRRIYNYCKHRGKPLYKEIEDLDRIRFFSMFLKTENELVKLPSDISDVQIELKLVDEIQRLKHFDDEVLFPYLLRLFSNLEDAVGITPFIVS